MLKESYAGYINNTTDVMQVNVNGDWDAAKKRIGLTNGEVPDAQTSIRAGILWLYWKGVLNTGIQYTDGKPSGADVIKWTGRDDWQAAVKKYNASPQKEAYIKEYKEHLEALLKSYSKDGLKEKLKKEVKK